MLFFSEIFGIIILDVDLHDRIIFFSFRSFYLENALQNHEKTELLARGSTVKMEFIFNIMCASE